MKIKQQGMTLVEVVVAMFIVGLGLTMIVSMMQSSLKYQADAVSRSDALNLMEEMIARMRMNFLVAHNYTFGSYDKYDSWLKPTISTTCNECSDNLKLAFQQSKLDVDHWVDDVATALPGGKVIIDQPNASNYPNQYRIQIQWLMHLDTARAEEAGVAVDKSPMRIETVFSL